MDKKLNVAVIGVGHLGKEHARVYAKHPDVNLVGLVDIDEKKVQKLAKKFHTEAYTNFRSITSRIDAVSVATPTNRHYMIAQELLVNDVHVLIEKPITETVEQADTLIKIAKEKQLILQVGHIERFNPAFESVVEYIKEPKFIECHRLAPYNPRGTEVGVVLDIMIHDIDIILHLVKSEPVRIDALGVGILHDSEDIANARIEFKNGAVANITASRVSLKQMRKIRIFQPYTYISLDYNKRCCTAYSKQGKSIKRKYFTMKRGEPLQVEINSFIECVRFHKKPLVSGEDGKKALEIATEIIRQIKSRIQNTQIPSFKSM